MEFVKFANINVSDIERGVIGHGVNCKLVMASGIAKDISDTWPIVKTEYLGLKDSPKKDRLLGRSQIVDISEQLYVINMFTQLTYGRVGIHASASAIERCVSFGIVFAKTLELPFYIPRIGCGLGGLDWENNIAHIITRVSQHNKYLTTVIDKP